MREDVERTRQRARAADEDVERLLGAIEASRTSGRAAEMPKLSAGRATRAEVEQRFQRARELAKSGRDDAKAMEEFLWCFDEGMGYGLSFMVMRSDLIQAMGELAKRYGPMREAMVERQDRAERSLLADAQDMDSVTELAALSRHLDDSVRIVDVMSKLTVGDNRRQTLMNMGGFDALLEKRRYGEILMEESFAELSHRFEFLKAAAPANFTAAQKADFRLELSRSTAKSIEALAGAGYSDEARELVRKVLAFNDTPETRRILAERLERAGHPELLER